MHKAMFVLGLMLLVPLTLNASIITVDSIADSAIIDFSQFGSYGSNPFGAPVQVGSVVGSDVTLSGSPYGGGNGAWLYNSPWGLASNGSWNSARNGYAGYAYGPGYMEFAFNDGPVAAVGAFMNDAPGFGTDLIISAYGTSGLLESYNITVLYPIVTPSGINDGAFRGIERSSADITSFRVFGYVPVVDNLTFGGAGSQVPEPTSLLLLSSGLGMIGLAAWRRRK
jgi:hypothetical protein